MFGDEVGYMSAGKEDLSEDQQAKVDKHVKKLLQESEQRVEKLLMRKGKELRKLAKNLYWYDYLDAKEMDLIFKGGEIKNKTKVREWEFDTEIEAENTQGRDPVYKPQGPLTTS